MKLPSCVYGVPLSYDAPKENGDDVSHGSATSSKAKRGGGRRCPATGRRRTLTDHERPSPPNILQEEDAFLAQRPVREGPEGLRHRRRLGDLLVAPRGDRARNGRLVCPERVLA